MNWRIGRQRDMAGFFGRRCAGDAGNAVGRRARIYVSQWQLGGRKLGIKRGFILAIGMSPKEMQHLKS